MKPERDDEWKLRHGPQAGSSDSDNCLLMIYHSISFCKHLTILMRDSESVLYSHGEIKLTPFSR